MEVTVHVREGEGCPVLGIVLFFKVHRLVPFKWVKLVSLVSLELEDHFLFNLLEVL